MIVGHMATYPPREMVLAQTIESVAPQLDVLNVVLNEFTEPPTWLAKYTNVRAIVPYVDLKDTGKFYPKWESSDDIILLDDDIRYPTDYVVRMRGELSKYENLLGGNVVVGVHGTIFADVFTGRQNERNVLVFWKGQAKAKLVNQLGTGTVVLRGGNMPDFEFMRGSERFVDVRFARHCFQNDIGMVCVAREDGWMQPIETDNENLFQTFTTSWPANVVQEVQVFGGYGRLPLDMVMKLKVA